MKFQRFLTLRALPVTMLFMTALTLAAEIDWYSMDSGGGISSAGNIELVGVIGQHDTIRMTGGDLSLSGGYLALPPKSEQLFKDGFE